jgi:hypothetical protein
MRRRAVELLGFVGGGGELGREDNGAEGGGRRCRPLPEAFSRGSTHRRRGGARRGTPERGGLPFEARSAGQVQDGTADASEYLHALRF